MVDVTFKRVRSDGITVNLWVYGPNGFKRRLAFNREKARTDLQRNIAYDLYWIISGPVGGTLKVDRKREGLDADFSALVPEWTIRQDPRLPPGWPVARADKVSFTL